MRLIRSGFAALALLLAFLAQTAPASAEPLHDAVEQSVNAYRAAHGLPTVTASPTLQAAAQFMADNVATYGPPPIPHVSSDGRTMAQRLADAGYPVSSTWTAEIIAWGAPNSAAAMTLWLNSPPHAAVLNDPRYVAAGFGVACYGAYPCAWVVTFGSLVDRTFAGSAPAPVAPPPPSYHAAFYAESAYPVASPGEIVQWVIAFTNTGLTGWSTNANGARLGTQNPQDGSSILATWSWVAPNRPAGQTTAYVAPGQQAWFIVNLAAPAQPGTYRLYVRPVVDGVTWLEDAGAYVELVVR
jgi:hypothetical protein